MASRKSSFNVSLHERLYGALDLNVRGTSGFNVGFSIQSTKRPLHHFHGRKVHWALAVVKLYLDGVKRGIVPVYPDEATYRPPRFKVRGGKVGNRGKQNTSAGGLS